MYETIIEYLAIGGISVILLFFAVVFLAATLLGCYKLWLFKSGRNPYNRVCRKCGQSQDAHARPWNMSNQWWEDMMPVPDENCICHTFARNTG